MPFPAQALALAAALLLATAARAEDALPAIASFDAESAAILTDPRDLTLGPDGRLYVADTGADRIAILDADSLALLGSFGASDLSAPHDISFGPDGRAYVADTGRSRVAVYRLTGLDAVLEGTLADGIPVPEGVLAHPDGTVYVTSSAFGAIVAFRDGKPVAEAAGLSRPHDAVADEAGNLWVVDTGNRRLVQFSPALKELGRIEGPGPGLIGPRYMDMALGGMLLVADKSGNRIRLLSAAGKLMAELGGPGDADPTRFAQPNGVTAEGPVFWFTDSGSGRVLRYRMVMN